ncbi:MAG: DUF2917 domain-containing protein [Acidovorax sp.]|uniref:DUF2917 domain-containing protein n=1 Tax=Acidovorax sp. TaxID=1872122 RepID=UPI00262FB097|nr:DUF2917 domain-containing protein [Acidovorax sp.]MDH4418200.1 DUF2917 domain-containing protein [Acidovorax sp.]
MTISQTFKILSTAATAAAAPGVSTLLLGKALSLTPRAPMALRIAEGQAWVTLDAGPYGTGAEAGDVFLHAGQTLWVAAGQHAVVEPMGHQRLQYRFTRTPVDVASTATPWWRRAAFGSPSVAVASDACCA